MPISPSITIGSSAIWRKEMYTSAFNVEESDAMFSRTDPEVQRAVELMPKASALAEMARKVIAARTAGGK